MGLLQYIRGWVKPAEITDDMLLLRLPLQVVLLILRRDLGHIARACKLKNDLDLALFRRVLEELIRGDVAAARPDFERYLKAKTDKNAHAARMKMLTEQLGRAGLRAYDCEEKLCRFLQAIGLSRQEFPPSDWASRDLAREALAKLVEASRSAKMALPESAALERAFQEDLLKASSLALKRNWSSHTALSTHDMLALVEDSTPRPSAEPALTSAGR